MGGHSPMRDRFMRNCFILSAGSMILLLLGGSSRCLGQGKGPVDVDREILREIREAYKAPLEVHQDVLKDLRRMYTEPNSEKRQERIIRELKRLYVVTPQREEAILREIRRACDRQSPEQEERFFMKITSLEKLPEGAVPDSVQSNQAARLFKKLDTNGDGVLNEEEMPEPLRQERRRWDRNRDGVIDMDEYWVYYQRRLSYLSEEVAAGNIDLGLKRGGPSREVPSIIIEEEGPPVVLRAGKLPKGLPSWFEQLDTDKDGQVSFVEWRKGGKPLDEFAKVDRNNDGFITPEEALRFVELNGPEPAVTATRQTPVPEETKGKKNKRM